MASAIVPNPARSAYGPLWPYPVTRNTTSPGFSTSSTLLGAESQPLERARPEVLDQHIGVSYQVEQHLAPGRLLQVELDGRLLRPVMRQ